MLIYMDDWILTGNNNEFLERFVCCLSKQFSLRNLGSLNYFLGIELLSHKNGVVMCQNKYIQDILQKSNMDGTKKASTSITISTSLSLNDGSTSMDGEEYRKIIGSLQYLTITRPDISYVVNKLSQFMHKPTSQHLLVLKRVLRYLKGTLSHGLMLIETKNLSFRCIQILTGQGIKMTEHPSLLMLFISAILQSHGARKSSQQLQGLPPRLSTAP